MSMMSQRIEEYNWQVAKDETELPTDDVFVMLQKDGNYAIVRPQKYKNQLYYEKFNSVKKTWEFAHIWRGGEYIIIDKAKHPKGEVQPF